MRPRTNTQRALGCIVGSAVGDALGAPFEFGPGGRYSAKYPESVIGGVGEMQGGGPWKPGEATDDTQMAIIEAEILVHSGLDYPAMYEAFRAWAGDPGTKDVGTTTGGVLRHPAGYPAASRLYFEQTGKGAANGCIMRAAPSAVYLAAQSEIDADRASRLLTAVTHGDPVAGWARMVLNRLLRAGITGGDPIDALGDALAALPRDIREEYGHLLADGLASHPQGNNSLAWVCLAQAVWAVRTSGSFAEAVVRAIDIGGDTDTVAAVAGGIAGARWGIAAIPSRWTAYLHVNMHGAHPKAWYGLEGLHDLTRALVGEADRPFFEPDPIGPTEIEDGVHAASLTGAETTPQDWTVISMSRTKGRLDGHPYRRAFYIIDKNGVDNDLCGVVTDTVDSIDAFVAEGRKVVVHCQTGNSRTGLILRAWLMRRHGWTDEESLRFIGERWKHVGLWNDDFTRFLRSEWTQEVRA